MRPVYRFLADDAGPAAVEYALLAALILGTILGSVHYVMRGLGV